MKKIFLLWISFGFITLQAQTIQEVGPEWINAMNRNQSDTLYIINFWGTWCKPCIEEMPALDSIHHAYADKKVKVILVSTDMRRTYESRLKSFVEERQIHPQVVWMNEPDGEKWIPLVSASWEGVIPSTWILYRPGKYNYFREGEITFQELKERIDKQLK